jgi:hypothetical protein
MYHQSRWGRGHRGFNEDKALTPLLERFAALSQRVPWRLGIVIVDDDNVHPPELIVDMMERIAADRSAPSSWKSGGNHPDHRTHPCSAALGRSVPVLSGIVAGQEIVQPTGLSEVSNAPIPR